MFRFLKSKQESQKSKKHLYTTKATKNKKRTSNAFDSDNKNFPYAGIKIIPSDDSPCDDAISKSQIIFLQSDAPLIPLPLCTNRYYCKCSYQHFKDRRGEARRETDIGLPDRFSGDNRRTRKSDRRVH